ncbi:50S ribosomal subunit protein L6 [Wigglesworthia glossinidia endosymbiont of Glossina morsitans morsitans (Yale colony)]|uniref:50S ribosomal protein L6 n=1 Tax=Wigglesworthia glossinidia endosymbiont of Glossina morsitans morsitans (Yale colony) TaxID=1142511 RepID=H6Q4H8_WIGGL|nr:50S ribosomal protein L6 [Wigglesworthia glossinidia]AFA41038.1 50S ribosomal subunit protein L6 [Wigglesworthia glossinidia endosymbiont of Glossina morsitans morsitans (Yale colony)]
MFRIAKMPILIPEKVNVNILKKNITISGIHGELNQKLHSGVHISKINNTIKLAPKQLNSNFLWILTGTMRSIINNMIIGVTQKFTKTLIISGIGYRANITNNQLVMSLGFSHIINVNIPENISVKCTSSNEIILTSIDKQKMGQFAANIRNYKIPDPYKGKGIRYSYEILKIKETKKNK